MKSSRLRSNLVPALQLSLHQFCFLHGSCLNLSCVVLWWFSLFYLSVTVVIGNSFSNSGRESSFPFFITYQQKHNINNFKDPYRWMEQHIWLLCQPLVIYSCHAVGQPQLCGANIQQLSVFWIWLLIITRVNDWTELKSVKSIKGWINSMCKHNY